MGDEVIGAIDNRQLRISKALVINYQREGNFRSSRRDLVEGRLEVAIFNDDCWSQDG